MLCAALLLIQGWATTSRRASGEHFQSEPGNETQALCYSGALAKIWFIGASICKLHSVVLHKRLLNLLLMLQKQLFANIVGNSG